MKKLSILTCVLALAGLVALPAAGGVVYNNDFGGVVSGDNYNVDAWPINFGYSIANSVTLGSTATITGVNFALWAFPDDVLRAMDWSILSNNGANPLLGTVLASGTANPAASLLVASNGHGYPVFQESFSIPALTLNAGTTYWLVLGNAFATDGDAIYWDQSDGPSTGYASTWGYLPSTYPCQGLCTGSESFELLSSAVPEPGTWMLLVGGLLTLAPTFLRRKK